MYTRLRRHQRRARVLIRRLHERAIRQKAAAPPIAPPVSGDDLAVPNGGVKALKIGGLLFSGDGSTKWAGHPEFAARGGGLDYVTADGRIRNRNQVRKLIGSTELKILPTPFTVRFGPDDIETIDIGDFKIVVDTVDAAVSGTIIADKSWEPHTTAIMKQYLRPGMTMLDIGANTGWFTMLAAGIVGSEGRVIAVEPWSENCRLILLSIAENSFTNIELWPFALDRARGWAHFMTYVGSNAGFVPESMSAIRDGMGSIVPTFSLDETFPLDATIDFMKIDVEGAEYRILQGAEKTLERCRPVIISEFSLWMPRQLGIQHPEKYLSWFTERDWTLHVITNPSGELVQFATPQDLLDWWPGGEYHIVDLFLLPS